MANSYSSRLCPLPDLESAVFDLLSQIPTGKVTTYGDLARALGDEKASAARWLGELFSTHKHFYGCFCHRVVRANGEVGLYYSGDPLAKAALLQTEGVSVSAQGKIDLNCRYSDFASERPLLTLKQYQTDLAQQCRQLPLEQTPRTFAGVDCAYRADGTGVGAYVELDAETLEVTYQSTYETWVSFPYIPGFLSFRELPILLRLLDQVIAKRPLADVIFVDGNGRLHPWRAGIATCLGVLIKQPTIGIGKSLLCGKVDLAKVQVGQPESVTHDGEVIGSAIKPVSQFLPLQEI